jgi:hypothetical protein
MKIRKWVLGESFDARSLEVLKIQAAKKKLGQLVAGRFRDRQMLPEFKLLRLANHPFSAAKLKWPSFSRIFKWYNSGFEMCVFL